MDQVNETLDAKAEETASNDAEDNDVVQVSKETVEDLVRRETHDRVLKESNKWKHRALAAEQKVESSERETLESQAKWKELYEQTRTKYEEAQQREVSLKLGNAVTKKASEVGCLNVDDLMSLGDTSLLNYDPETGEVHGVDMFVEQAKATKPYLFSSKVPSSVNSTLPSGGLKVEPGKEDYSKLSKDAILERLQALDKK